jgi:hypothetical protein
MKKSYSKIGSAPEIAEGQVHPTNLRKEIVDCIKELCSVYEQQYKKNTAPVNIYSVLKDKIVETAKEHEIPVSELIEDLLEEGLQRMEEEESESEDDKKKDETDVVDA